MIVIPPDLLSRFESILTKRSVCKGALMITDTNQAYLAKITVRGVQEEAVNGFNGV